MKRVANIKSKEEGGQNNMDIAVYGDVHIHTAETKEEINLHTIRTSDTVTFAKKNVKMRDRCCQICGEIDKPLECHHILPVAKFPSLADDETNMIVLCQHHHRKYHELYEGSEGADTFAKYMRDYGGDFHAK